MTIDEGSFASVEAAAGALAHDIAFILQEAISARDQASLVVSGGRTPRHVFHCLRQQEVDWARVMVTLTDERWVPVDRPDSNEWLVRSVLLLGSARAATFIPLYGGENTPEEGLSKCEARLAAMRRPFDAVYLGMGSDGHFASLFPSDPALEVHNRFCVAVPGTDTREPRMTLTAPTILDARKLFLLYSGPEKHAVYAKARRAGSIGNIPLRLVLSQESTPVSVFNAP